MQAPNPVATDNPGGTRQSRSLLRRLRNRLRGRPDTEHEMTINRLVLSGIVLIYIVIASWYGSEAAREMLRTTGIYFGLYQGLSLFLFAHILYQPGISVERRLCGIALDVSMFSYCMYAGGEATAPFFPFYLWLILGNGFRFGNFYLFTAAGASVVMFAAVALTNGYWLSHQALAAGLLASLVFLPIYVSTLIRKLSAAKRQAEEANRAKGLFLASISHELRTPLNAIIGLGGLLRDQMRDSEHRHMVQTIVNSGRSLLSLINNILDFSRIEAGQMPRNLAETDLYDAMRRIEAMLAVQAHAKSLAFNVHVTARTPARIYADFGHIEQILVNLAANAIKFTEAGFVAVAIDAMHENAEHVRLRVEVTDTGIGIAPEAQSRIFESFTQADATILDQYGGTGLGLAISKQLVRLLNGEIGLESTPGKGSTFWFEVDAKPLPGGDVPSILDDQPVIIVSRDATLNAALSDLGRHVSRAESAEDAASLLALADEHANPVVAVDVRTATADSSAIEETLRAIQGRTRMVLAVTDMPGLDWLPTPVRAYCASSVAVPVSTAELEQAVRIALSRREAAGEEAEPSVASVPPGRALSILVAEDNRTNQMVIAKILERAGHKVEIVEDGQAAFDTLVDNAFDLVLMDVNMPVMNGIEAAKLYRFAAIGQPRIPIVALTADATEETNKRCLEAGMDACITKPVEPARLIETIASLIPSETGEDLPTPVHDGVTDIDSHPRFRADVFFRLDFRVIEELKELGGTEFVCELANQFIADAEDLVDEIETAAASGDIETFHDRVHALRSAAANIGAQQIYELCLSWREIEDSELLKQGAGLAAKLKGEFEHVRTIFASSQFNAYASPSADLPPEDNVLKLPSSVAGR